jgi:hypothetical protein
MLAWLVLFASAAPAWSCAAAMLEADCCPGHSSAPCPDDATDPASGEFAQACCAAMPAQPAASPQAFLKAGPDEPPDVGAPSPLNPVAAAAAEAQAVARHALPFDPAVASVRDATPVYLRTSRLRL